MSHLPTVRVASGTDAAAIQSLYRQLVDDDNVNVGESQLQMIEEDTNTRLFVAEIDGNVCATVLVCLCSDAMYSGQPFAVVENLVVDERNQKKGIGRALLREVDQFCLARNCSKIMLLSSVARAEAHRFFEHVGYRADLKRGFVKYRRQFVAGD